MRARYLVFDGLDGSGKGAQLSLLEQRLEKIGLKRKVVFTREPGGTEFAELIRNLVLDPLARKSTPFNNMLLFFAAREDLLHKLVIPALRAGHAVISDRGDSSTFAFQLYGEEHRQMLKSFEFLRDEVFGLPELRSSGPDLYIFFDLPPEVAYERRKADARERTHFDLQPVEYHERVRKGFQEFKRLFRKGRRVIVDANRPIGEVHEETWKIVSEELDLNSF